MFFDHEGLKSLSSKQKVNSRYIKWSEFLQLFLLVLKNNVGVENHVVDALSQQHSLLSTGQVNI